MEQFIQNKKIILPSDNFRFRFHYGIVLPAVQTQLISIPVSFCWSLSVSTVMLCGLLFELEIDIFVVCI